jgi:hypothetical protein
LLISGGNHSHLQEKAPEKKTLEQTGVAANNLLQKCCHLYSREKCHGFAIEHKSLLTTPGFPKDTTCYKKITHECIYNT